jgi:hypothetical protein
MTATRTSAEGKTGVLCGACNTTYAQCTSRLRKRGNPCCSKCAYTDTHDEKKEEPTVTEKKRIPVAYEDLKVGDEVTLESRDYPGRIVVPVTQGVPLDGSIRTYPLAALDLAIRPARSSITALDATAGHLFVEAWRDVTPEPLPDVVGALIYASPGREEYAEELAYLDPTGQWRWLETGKAAHIVTWQYVKVDGVGEVFER